MQNTPYEFTPYEFFIHLLTPAILFDIIYQELNIP